MVDYNELKRQMKIVRQQVDALDNLGIQNWQNTNSNLINNLNSILPSFNQSNLRYEIESSLNVSFSKSFLHTYNQYYSKFSNLNNISPALDTISNLSEEVKEVMGVNFSQLVEIEEEMQNKFDILSEIQKPSNRIIEAVVSLKTAIECYNLPKTIIENSFSVPNAYQVFAKSQYNYAIDNEEIHKRAIEIADYAGEVVVGNQLTTEKNLQILDDVELSEKEEKEKDLSLDYSVDNSNIFKMLNQHLAYVYRSDRDPNIYEAIDNSLPMKVHQLGRIIVELTYKINKYVQATTGDCIFKPTVEGLRAPNILTGLVADGKNKFAEVIDSLYFILYEGSGTANRLTDILPDEKYDDQLQPLWDLKHLRREFRHDLEHGDGIKRKLQESGNAFKKLINKPRPVSTSDWKNTQVALYKHIINMLSTILKEINE